MTPVRISELSQRSGVATATIKYYLREGLLQPGAPRTATSAEYTAEHLRRLRLIRALIEVGGLSVAATRRVLDAAADSGVNRFELLGTLMYALYPATTPPQDPERGRTRAWLGQTLKERGWLVSANAPAWERLVGALVALQTLGYPAGPVELAPYLAAVEAVAKHDLDLLDRHEDRAEVVEAGVVQAVLYESVLAALRQLAQESEAAHRYAAVPCEDPEAEG